MSADRAGIFESMVKVPIPDQDGQEVTCMLDYSIDRVPQRDHFKGNRQNSNDEHAKTEVCKFWRKGRCKREDKCPYRHSGN